MRSVDRPIKSGMVSTVNLKDINFLLLGIDVEI
jgi:hypothetical protein